MTSNDFLCMNEIIHQALMKVGNEDFSDGTPEGYYRNAARSALNELSFDTFFSLVHKDYFNWNEDGNYRIKYPKGCFNLREIYIFDGDHFKVSNSKVVDKARNFKNHPLGDGYTRERKDHAKFNSNYFYNVQGSMIMLSRSCEAKKNVRVVFNGIYGDIGEEPLVPRFFEKYVVSTVKVAHYERAKNMENKRGLRRDWLDELQIQDREYDKARWRIAKMDAKERDSMEEYLSRMNF